MALDASTPNPSRHRPTTPPPAPIRQSTRTRKPPVRIRSNDPDNSSEATTPDHPETNDTNDGRNTTSPTIATSEGEILEKVAVLTKMVATLVPQNAALLETVQQCKERITKLETQNATLTDMVRKLTAEQTKTTQSWAKVAARANASQTTVPVLPMPLQSLARTSTNPGNPASQAPEISRPSIVLDLSRTADRVGSLLTLKEDIQKALRKCEQTKDVNCIGLQRRTGGEDLVRITLHSEDEAQLARKHDQWLQEPRLRGARILGEQWYPVKVDRVNRSSISPNATADIAKEAAEAIARENNVKIQQIRWLSKPSDKLYGSAVVFLADRQTAEMLLAKGHMDFGGEMAYTRVYERRRGPNRCFKCHQYGHLEARCKATAATCSKCAQTGHEVKDCTSSTTRCAACKGPHKATDRTCPAYLEALRRMNPVEHYD